MKMIVLNIQNLFNRIPFFKGNSLQNNLLIILGGIAFVVISIDLQTPMALEKNEISSVIVILEETEDSTVIGNTFSFNTSEFQFICFVPFSSDNIIHNVVFNCLKDRSPPCFI